MACHHIPGGLQDLLDETWSGGKRELKVLTQITLPNTEPVQARQAVKPDGDALSPYQFAKKVDKVIDDYVRPMLERDGGNLEIVDIKDHLIYCRLVGACQGCSGAGQTLRMLVERTLKEMVDERTRVISV
jgi:Fe-S cluster biogenesis protein NfuA